MKIVWVTDECPYPPNTGGRVGVWKRIEYLSERNDIYLFTVIDDLEEKEYRSEMLNWCKEVNMFERNSKLNSLLLTIKYPYPGASRWSKQIKSGIELTCEKIKPDYVIVDGPHMIGTLSERVIKKEHVVLNQHNIEHLSLSSIGRGTNNILKKVLYNVTSYQMRKYEESLYATDDIDLYTFVSSSDMDYFEKNYQLSNTLLVPVGAELKFSDIVEGLHTMIFVAKMSYQSNEDGAIWLLDNIWDTVCASVSDAKLYLVGKDPSERLKGIASKHNGVVVTGTVDSIDEYYEKTNLVVVPILAGGGVKVKLLEALGHGKLVVTTQKGIEGTDFENGKHLFTASNKEDFAEKCIKILEQPCVYKEINAHSRIKMEKEYSWKGVIDAFEKVLREKGMN